MNSKQPWGLRPPKWLHEGVTSPRRLVMSRLKNIEASLGALKSRLSSKVFEIAMTGKYYSLMLPEEVVLPFVEKNMKRVKVEASFKGKELTFHGAIQKRQGNYYMMFGKRYQKKIGHFTERLLPASIF